MNASDLMSAVSYALRVEVQIHSIVSGSAFTALLKFVRLLESVSWQVARSSVLRVLWVGNGQKQAMDLLGIVCGQGPMMFVIA